MANVRNMDAHVALLRAANPDAAECVCRCKVLTEIFGVTYPDDMRERVARLRDPRLRDPRGGDAGDPDVGALTLEPKRPMSRPR